MLVHCPSGGVCFGLTYGGKLPRRLGTAGLVILLAVYVRLKVMGGLLEISS